MAQAQSTDSQDTNFVRHSSKRMTKKKEREKILARIWSKPTPQELDVQDKGDHIKVTSMDEGVGAWWLGTLRALYPQDHYSESRDGASLKMRPAAGVTLKLDRGDGTLKIKGKHHWRWFRDNFEQLVDSGATGSGARVHSEMVEVIDQFLKLDDKRRVSSLLQHLSNWGAVKHGPTYIYRLWRGLLDDWLGQSGNGVIYVVTPLIDAKRLVDIVLLLIKHRLSLCHVQLMILSKCDGDSKFPKVWKQARDIIKDIKGSNKKPLVSDERLRWAMEKLEPRYGGFHCKFIACCTKDYTELLTTSANFHKWHFDLDNGDMVAFHKISTSNFTKDYLEPLGLVRPVSMTS